jgi:hypothetical protein
MAYATAADLRARIGKVSVTSDTVLTALIAAAQQNVNDFCNRPDGFEALAVGTARIYSGSGLSYQWIDECVSVSAVAVKESATDATYTAWAAGDYITARGDPRDPNFNRLPKTMLIVDPTGSQSIFTGGRYSNLQGFPPDIDAKVTSRGVPTIQVTAKWGYSVTPPTPVKEACLIEATRLFKRFESGMSDTLASSELGQLMYTKEIDPDAKLLLVLGRYVRPPIG